MAESRDPSTTPQPSGEVTWGVPAPILIGGATATGKSEVALLLAEHLSGEIISVDSMQVYRGLEIGTDKPSPGARARVPHHLLDCAGLDEAFDAARFVREATRARIDIQRRGRRPILSGGTGLYFRALFGGLGSSPASDPQLRKDLEQLSPAVLLQELKSGDPELFATIDQQNLRRVVRAVEVLRKSGRAFSNQRARWDMCTRRPPFFVLSRSSDDLHRRISLRVDNMVRSGLVAETEALLSHGLSANPHALQAIGYRQVVEYLKGDRALDETIELVKQRTRQLAKRQATWFRKEPGTTWIHVEPDEPAANIVRRITQHSLSLSALR